MPVSNLCHRWWLQGLLTDQYSWTDWLKSNRLILINNLECINWLIIIISSSSSNYTEIKINWQKLETVTGFKYLGSVLNDEGSNPEILSRTAQTTAALTRLKPVWNDMSISLSSKICLMHSLVTSIFLYACESWTLTAELQRRIQAMEMRCYCKILHSSYRDHVTNVEVCAKIEQAIRPHEDLLTQTAVVRMCLLLIRSGQNHLARHSERVK